MALSHVMLHKFILIIISSKVYNVLNIALLGGRWSNLAFIICFCFINGKKFLNIAVAVNAL